MRKCSQCSEEKDDSLFYYRSDGTSYSYCKMCSKKNYASKNYQDNKERYKKGSATRTQQRLKLWKEFKLTQRCSICGDNKPWRLDFHHVDGGETKEGNLPNLFINGSIKAFEEELKKCIPVCRNCHADIHFKSAYE